MEENFTIEVLCLFCHSTLTADEDMEFESGDLIKCNSCGEMNDYDSVVEVAKEKAEKLHLTTQSGTYFAKSAKTCHSELPVN